MVTRPQAASDNVEDESPIHPYAKQSSSQVRTQPASIPLAQSSASKDKPIPAFRKDAPIHDGRIAGDVFKRALKSRIELSQEELLSLSPEVRELVRQATSAKRVPTEQPRDNPVSTMFLGEVLPFSSASEEEGKATDVFVAKQATKEAPPGSTIIEEKIASFIEGNYEVGREELVVAQESLLLRTVRPLVDNKKKVEAIIDPGCQIIAMSQAICHDLGLTYDPKITLNMQSANGEIDRSLGLARNVPFTFGDLTLYLQVHIIKSPAYDILLGRPFDVLTSSVVTNYPNEDQTLTLTDPNTGAAVTVPTISRDRRPFTETRLLSIAPTSEGLQMGQGFH